MCSFAVAGICSWNNVPHSILPYLRLDNWGTLRSVQYLAVQRLLRIVLCVPICNSGADRKWGGIKTEQPTGTTKIAWRRAFSQFLELVNCGVLTACLSSRNLHFVSRKPWVLFSFYGSNFFFLFTTLSANTGFIMWSLSAEVRVRSHFNQCEICGEKSGTVARGEFRPRQTRQLPRAVDLKGRLLSCQSY